MLNNFISFTLILFAAASFASAQEKTVTEIILEGSANDRSLEMSGLTWYKDELILLPQYIDYDDPAFYSISKHQLNNWLNQKSPKPIVPQKIKIVLPDFRKSIKGYQGFEAVCFDGRNVYLIIESKDNDFMKSYMGKTLPEKIVEKSFSYIIITSEPLENSVYTFAERADSLGYLGRDGYSLDGIFYHENISVTSNEENQNG